MLEKSTEIRSRTQGTTSPIYSTTDEVQSSKTFVSEDDDYYSIVEQKTTTEQSSSTEVCFFSFIFTISSESLVLQIRLIDKSRMRKPHCKKACLCNILDMSISSVGATRGVLGAWTPTASFLSNCTVYVPL